MIRIEAESFFEHKLQNELCRTISGRYKPKLTAGISVSLAEGCCSLESKGLVKLGSNTFPSGRRTQPECPKSWPRPRTNGRWSRHISWIVLRREVPPKRWNLLTRNAENKGGRSNENQSKTPGCGKKGHILRKCMKRKVRGGNSHGKSKGAAGAGSHGPRTGASGAKTGENGQQP